MNDGKRELTEMTQGIKSKKPLETGWDFAFLTDRAAPGTMRHPSKPKRAQEEEARAGLSMVKYQQD